MKVSSVPATTPGIDSGRVTLRNAVQPAGVQVACRLQQPGVEPLQARVERQHHERQEVVRQPGDHRDRGGQQPAVGAEDVQGLQRVTTKPLSDRIVFQASVRTRKLVKNGAITSTSIRFFQRPALSAIAYASG